MSDTEQEQDWREWAYLQRDNWPDAIPWTGPKREYGPCPWTEPTHHDPHGLDDYPHVHPDAASIGHSYHGDVCPYCGVPLRWDETVTLVDGTQGVYHDIEDIDSPTPAYHLECYDKRRGTIQQREHKTLDKWTGTPGVTSDD